MESDWVDFRTIKAAVTMNMVLDRYGVTLKKSGNELRGKCPIHRGSNNKHFTVNVSKNVFKCFFASCGVNGNVLDFVAAMEHCSVRDAALKLKEWFRVGESESPSIDELDPDNAESDLTRGIYSNQDGALFEVITNALSGEDFEPLVVYRELFGEYRVFVASPENFGPKDRRFTLVKAL